MTGIRSATVEDIGTILHLLKAMAGESGGVAGSTEQALKQYGFGPVPRFKVLIAEANEALGFVLFFPEYSTWRGEMGLFVQDIYVTPPARGNGLARQMLQAAMVTADWSPSFMTLMVARENLAARAAYAALGMTQRGDADQLILEGEGIAALMRT